MIDTSAIIAIMNNEPERCRFNELIEAARGLSANEELVARQYSAEVEAARLRDLLKTALSEARWVDGSSCQANRYPPLSANRNNR